MNTNKHGIPLANQLRETKTKLQANNKQMAKHMGMDVSGYEAIESGARVLPIVHRNRCKRRAERLLERCGLK